MSVRRCGQTVDDFVDGAVSAAGNDELAAFGSGAAGDFGGIAWPVCLREIGVNACGGENAPCAVQITKTPTAAIAGSRVVNQERVGKSCEHAFRQASYPGASILYNTGRFDLFCSTEDFMAKAAAAKNEIEQLREKIRHHEDRYY